MAYHGGGGAGSSGGVAKAGIGIAALK